MCYEIVASKYDPQIYRLKWRFFCAIVFGIFYFCTCNSTMGMFKHKTNSLYPFFCMWAKHDLSAERRNIYYESHFKKNKLEGEEINAKNLETEE